MKRNQLLLFFLLLMWGGVRTGITAQPIITHEMAFLDQLPSKEVVSLYQDRKGFVWVGTTHGLGRFDGYDLQVFRSDYLTPGKLLDNRINCLTESAEYICVGTPKGLNLLDKRSFRMFSASNQRFLNTSIKSLFRDRSGNVWIATDKQLYKCNDKLSILRSYRLNLSGGCALMSMYQDRDGAIWALTWGHGLYKYDKGKDRFVSLPKIGEKNTPFTMCQDKNGRYWIGTWGDGLYRFMPENSSDQMYIKQQVTDSRSSSSESIFFDMLQDDSRDYLWVLSYYELYAFKLLADGGLEKVEIGNLVDVHKMYSKLMKDREGNLWLGAFDSGYNLTFEKTKIQNYPLGVIKQVTGLDPNLNCIQEDGEGVVWLNQERCGLNFYRKGSGTLGINGGKVVSNLEVDRIARSHQKNRMWLSSSFLPLIFKATREGMNLCLEDTLDLGKYVKNPGLVNELWEDGNGNLWIATTDHFFVKPFGQKEIWNASEELARIGGIAEDSEGRIWVGSKSKGLYQVSCSDKGIHVVAHYPAKHLLMRQNEIEHLCIDKEDRIWIATSLGAMLQFDPKQKVFRDQTTSCGMNGDVILNLFSQKEDLWIVNPTAVVQHNLTSGDNVLYTTVDENIGVSSFRNRAACLGNGGVLYAGGHGGFVAIGKEDVIRKAKYAKKVEITDVKVGGKSVFFTDSLNYDSRNTGGSVHLLPDERNIEISFSDLTYFSNKKSKYAYKLKGIDEDWIVLEKGRHTAFYNHLPKGDYQFKVRSTNELGEWSEESTVFHIVRRPAWFETGYAYGGYGIAIIGSVVFVFYYSARLRRRSRQRQNLEREINVGAPEYRFAGERFLNDIVACVEKHLTEPDFDLERLAAELNVSKSTMNRKIKAMVGLTPMDFVKNVKLKCACKMLRNANATVSEVAYALGFNNPKYFTKCFKEEFGVTPTQYQQSSLSEEDEEADS